METASYSQSDVSSLIFSTSLPGVRRLPDDALRGFVCPVARILSLVPPMSTTRTLLGGRSTGGDGGLGVSSTTIGLRGVATTSTPDDRGGGKAYPPNSSAGEPGAGSRHHRPRPPP